ncbi:hypothetical protein [Rhodoferax antarcticus]|uniref:hypothetical protein n=1 Tax=Rhodoferax antarcticus TaxID=81479 RepID=UPI001115066B|nr:hypothetical protein [Rhodoferax antarcticus]
MKANSDKSSPRNGSESDKSSPRDGSEVAMLSRGAPAKAFLKRKANDKVTHRIETTKTPKVKWLPMINNGANTMAPRKTTQINEKSSLNIKSPLSSGDVTLKKLLTKYIRHYQIISDVLISLTWDNTHILIKNVTVICVLQQNP